jgi:CRISPR system Cascade subunit CasD
MATLLMRFQAPLQSWGVSSLFTERDTSQEPSKSGVIGLICAALGRGREANLSDLVSMRMGVRVDREGKLEVDFQTARNILASDGKTSDKSVISNRYYLSDAAFLVGLEGDKEALEVIHRALRSPKWPLYLGRKAFPPGTPVWLEDGLRDGELEAELRSYHPLVHGSDGKLRLILESENGQFTRQDVPISFAGRKFTGRSVSVTLCDRPGKEGV